MTNDLARPISALAIWGMLAAGTQARAAEFVLDPSQSYLQACVYLGGPPAAGGTLVSSAQVPGSDTVSLQGSFSGDTDGSSYIRIDNYSATLPNEITASNYPTNVLPDPNGGQLERSRPQQHRRQRGATIRPHLVRARVWGMAGWRCRCRGAISSLRSGRFFH